MCALCLVNKRLKLLTDKCAKLFVACKCNVLHISPTFSPDKDCYQKNKTISRYIPEP